MSANEKHHAHRTNVPTVENANGVSARWFIKPLHLFLLISALSVAGPSSTSCTAQENSAGEYELKGAMIYNLINFVEWPSSAYSDLRAPTVLCILGWDPFGASLTSLVSNKFVDRRPVQIRHLRDVDGPRACHILYISSSERRRLVSIMSDLKGSSVLTVGDMDQFAARGGMVQFALYEKRLLLEINLDAANRAGVKLSSRLLAIARIVKDQGNNSSREGFSTDLQKFATTDPGHDFRSWKFARGISNSVFEVGSQNALACQDLGTILPCSPARISFSIWFRLRPVFAGGVKAGRLPVHSCLQIRALRGRGESDG